MIRRIHAAAVLLVLFAQLAPCAGGGPATRSAPTPLYTEIVDDYMGGQWDKLDAALRDNGKEIAALPKDLAADVAGIKLAVAECRPAWWNTIKAGKKVLFHPMLMGHSLNVTFDPALKSSMQLSRTNDISSMTVNWAWADMDSTAPGEHGFSKGDLTDLGVFAVLGSLDTWVSLPPAQVQLNEAEKIALGRFIDFRGNIAGIAYGMPGGRRWGIWLFLDSYNAKFAEMQSRMGRKALAALFIEEVLSHPEVYTSVELPATLAAENAEETLALALLKTIEKHPWTLAEDNALRAAAKQFLIAAGIKTYTSGIAPLPNKLGVALDPAADKPLQAKRDAWVKAQFDKAAKAGG